MRLTELQERITKANPAAVLVSARVIENIVSERIEQFRFRWVTPHTRCLVTDRSTLFRHVEQEDLALHTHHLLPEKVILLARPDNEELNGKEPGQLLLRYWQAIFHGRLHMELDRQVPQSEADDWLVRRIARIGITEFEEIRLVLDHESLLLDARDDRETYLEFVATFLELRRFAPELVRAYFPGITDPDAIESLVGEDLDVDTIFRETRPEGAADPGIVTTDSEYEAHEYYRKLFEQATRLGSAKEHVRAAIVFTKAARVAPPEKAGETRRLAAEELSRLTTALSDHLHLGSDQEHLQRYLMLLLDKADQGRLPIEAKILTDFQNIWRAAREETYALAAADWLFSLGRRPLRRPLPSQRIVNMVQHLRGAIEKLTYARIDDDSRKGLQRLLSTALDRLESELRDQFRPILVAAFEDVGLTPANAPEAVAFDKTIDEFLDRILHTGFVTFSELRDTISRNQLKLADLGSAREFVQGDPLLRLDRRLGAALAGVYRPGEIYMGWLERLTALFFGTRTGRFVTRFVFMPFGAALGVVEGAKIIASHTCHHFGIEAAEPIFAALHFESFLYWGLVGALGVFLLALIHSDSFRASCTRLARSIGQVLYSATVDAPWRILSWRPVQLLLGSWPVQLAYWYFFKPAAFTAVIIAVMPRSMLAHPIRPIVVFLVFFFLLNSRPGRILTRAMFQLLMDTLSAIRAGLFRGLYTIVVAFFNQLRNFVDYVLFRVDERLRVRAQDNNLTLAFRLVLGGLWFPISFVARFYTIVLIEPMINPVKLPISVVAAKIMLPMWAFLPVLAEKLTPFMGQVPAYAFVYINLTLLPDAVGFLFWEMKENWKMYKANRPKHLKPVVVGSHGETIEALLVPGLHSGTIPATFARLRRAEQEAFASANRRKVRASLRTLEEIEDHIRRFIEREMIALAERSEAWQGGILSCRRIHLANNCIDWDVHHRDFPAEPFALRWEWRPPWLIGAVRSLGWLEQCDGERLWSFVASLAYLYKLAGIQLVREQIATALDHPDLTFEIRGERLAIYRDRDEPPVAFYELHGLDDRLAPRKPDGSTDDALPVLDRRAVDFSQCPIAWQEVVETWERQGPAFEAMAHRWTYLTGKQLSVESDTPAVAQLTRD